MLKSRIREDDLHLESIKPPSAISMKAKATSKLSTKTLRELSTISDHPLSSSSSFPNPSRTSTFNKPTALYLSHIRLSLINLIYN